MRYLLFRMIVTCLLITGNLFASAQSKSSGFVTLTEGKKVNGFKTIALYLDDADKPIGARFIHDRSGFTLDLLQIESVPQTFIYVNTVPASDKGEPHTQEHLLITKGNKGRQLNTREGMSLAFSNAFTSQTHTAYHFYTAADASVFFKLFHGYMDALLHPDYTDEEIRREVRNWGVTENPADKSLRIEEKGSVYNEMMVSMNQQGRRSFMLLQDLVYGSDHPLSYSAGGTPEAIRTITPDDIKKYHSANYILSNMGAIVSLPKKTTVETTLATIDKTLSSLDNKNSKQRINTAANLPSPKPAEAGKITVATFPSKNAQEPGNMSIAFPAGLSITGPEKTMLQFFISTFSSGPNSNLYKKFVDTKTRTVDIGAQSAGGFVYDYLGLPIIFSFTGIPATNLSEEKAAMMRQQVIEELKTVAAYGDNSPELLAFNERLRNNITDTKRSLSKFISTPPKFGFRNTSDGWYDQLKELNEVSSFKKSLLFKEDFAVIEKQLQSGKNIWKNYIDKWKLTSANPYVVYTKADPSLLDEMEKSRKQRAQDEIARLKTKYNVSTDQEAISRYRDEYNSNSAALEKMEAAISAEFLSNPPLTLDDNLEYKQTSLPGNVKMLASSFNNMAGATTGIAIKLNGVPQDKLVYLAALPQLLTQTGYIKDGKGVSYQDMSQQLQKEILSLQSQYSTNMYTGRAELVVKGAGNNAEESQRAIEWMNTVLQSPYWHIDNISRIRDLIDQQLSGIRRTMQGAEENWVNDPANAYYAQNNPLMLATSSFLTRSHNLFRLRWMLKDAGDEKNRKSIDAFFQSLGELKAERDQLKILLGALQTGKPASENISAEVSAIFELFNELPAAARILGTDASRDLEQILNEIPDGSLVTDWNYLVGTIRKDLSQSPQQTLNDLNALRKSLLKKGDARLFYIGSQTVQQKLVSPINKLLSGFENGSSNKVNYPADRIVEARLKGRMKKADEILYVGLVNPNSQTGVFINSAPIATYKDTSREDMLHFLAALLHAGGGKQSVYTKSTGAGLSYSTGVSASPSNGRVRYYAERTPELPQTLRFVIDEIKRAPKDSAMKNYIISLALSPTRAASDYEVRGESMASDIEDGITPASIKAFRTALLKLRKSASLLDEVYKRKDEVYRTIMPGYGSSVRDVTDGFYFVIGPEKQMSVYEAYLKSVDGKDAQVYRLYPRDFWMVDRQK